MSSRKLFDIYMLSNSISLLIYFSIHMAKETNGRKDVTFYLLDNIGGNLRTRLTRIYFSPTNRKIEGRTAGEDRYPDAIAIEFNRGTYTTSNPDVIEFLRLYSFG